MYYLENVKSVLKNWQLSFLQIPGFRRRSADYILGGIRLRKGRDWELLDIAILSNADTRIATTSAGDVY